MIHNSIDEKVAEVGSRLIKLFESFSAEQINMKPAEGGWTAGQIMDHVLKFVSGVVQTLQAKGIASDRPLDAYAKNLEDVFLNFEVKYDAPDFVVPAEPPHDKERLLSKAHRVFTELEKLIREVDLSLIYEEFSLPGTPPMTRYEWVVFAWSHSERHRVQMERLQLTS
jgi:hypothetical protein